MRDPLAFVVASGFIVFWIVVLALAAKRMVGLRAGLPRLIIGGVAGLTVAVLALGQRLRDSTEWPFVVLFVGIGVLSAMGLLIVSEIVVPTGTRPRPVHWYRAFERWRRRTQRYAQVSRIALRHGLSTYPMRRRELTPRQRAELARRLRLALEEAGVAFVKFGQILSARHDLVPAEFIDELSRLQSQAAPSAWLEIESVLTEEFGAPVGEIFADFDQEPLAGASIAQVHRARLRSGERVVVKVQRPGIGRLVDGDLDIALRVGDMLHRRTAWARAIGMRDLAEGFAEALREELDFTVEARNVATVSATRSYDSVLVPRVHADLCTRRVLVMDFLDGVPLDQAGPIVDEHGLDRTGIARTLLHTLLTQIMLDGVFHADPHPGNVLLLRDGRLGLLDFGSVGRLDAGMRASLQHMLLAIDAADATALSDTLVDVVDRPEDIDEVGLERAIRRFMARHLGPAPSADVEMFTDMFGLVTRYGVAVPPELAAIFRALATVEGTLEPFAPGFDVVSESRAFAQAHLHLAVLPDSVRATVTAEVVRLLPLIRRLPRRLDRITSALEHGRLSTGVRLFADDRDRHVVTRLVDRTLLVLLASASGIVAAILLGTAGGPQVAPDLSLYQLIAYSLLTLGGALTLRVLSSILRGG